MWEEGQDPLKDMSWKPNHLPVPATRHSHVTMPGYSRGWERPSLFRVAMGLKNQGFYYQGRKRERRAGFNSKHLPQPFSL